MIMTAPLEPVKKRKYIVMRKQFVSIDSAGQTNKTPNPTIKPVNKIDIAGETFHEGELKIPGLTGLVSQNS